MEAENKPTNTIDVNGDILKPHQGKVTGIIIPPPEIRAVVDKTAQFVAKNGKSFENKILQSKEGVTAKFNFMKSYDPYHAYYEFKIKYNKCYFTFIKIIDYFKNLNIGNLRMESIMYQASNH